MSEIDALADKVFTAVKNWVDRAISKRDDENLRLFQAHDRRFDDLERRVDTLAHQIDGLKKAARELERG